MLVIALMTFREMLRKKVFGLTLLLTAGFLALYGTGLYFAFRDPPRDVLLRAIMSNQLLSAGLFFAGFITTFLVVLSSVGTLSGEIENGTMQAVVSKPIPRSAIVTGKFGGLGAMLAAYAAFLFTAVLLLNWIFSRLPWPPGWISALALFCFQPLILLGVALLGSARTSTLGNGVMVVTLYAVSMVGGFIEQIGALIDRPALVNLGIVSSLVLPVDAVYRKMALTLLPASEGGLFRSFASIFAGVSEPSAVMMLYAFFYLLLSLYLAVRAFERRDI